MQRFIDPESLQNKSQERETSTRRSFKKMTAFLLESIYVSSLPSLQSLRLRARIYSL